MLSSCYDQDVFPDTPKISFESISFLDADRAADSLILTFNFEDGNGDIGLSGRQDLFSPYQIYDVILNRNDSAVTISQELTENDFPLFKAPVVIDNQDGEIAYFFFPEEKVEFANEDARPAYNCENYEIIESDTFYIERNEFHHNIHIEFEERVGDDYVIVDFLRIFQTQVCDVGEFNGRIPIFDPEGQSGKISYAMISQGFTGAFQDNLVRVKFYIYDRNLNQSNIVTTPDFILADITQ